MSSRDPQQTASPDRKRGQRQRATLILANVFSWLGFLATIATILLLFTGVMGLMVDGA